ncbi:MAG: hypothetical protein H6557_00795 [Lewinellaceae bacterium]|nr:hypothetical protein [Phaeodactylibacter sp.]MCB9035137.1 hypothetical protein [Lewinellaceae bacterium]
MKSSKLLKCFFFVRAFAKTNYITAPSPVHAFHEAMGKYVNYRAALEEKEVDRVLYLAVPLLIFQNFFQRPFIQKMLHREKLKLIIYDPKTKNITKWTK